MRWRGDPVARVTARIAALSTSLQRSERRVVATVAENLSAAVECTAQELAARAGVGRASVIRTAQTLGYDGYPQMRVALAREMALAPSTSSSAESQIGRASCRGRGGGPAGAGAQKRARGTARRGER